MLFKPWVQSSFWIQQPEFHENVINSPMPCLIWFLWLLQSWFPISYSKQWYIVVVVVFFSKIFVETQDEVSIFTLLHTIIFFFYFYHSFFTKFLLGDLFSGTIFWSSFGMESYGGGDSRRGWYQMTGTWKKWPVRPKCLPMYYSTISVSFGVLSIK